MAIYGRWHTSAPGSSPPDLENSPMPFPLPTCSPTCLAALVMLCACLCPSAEDRWADVTLRTDAGITLTPDPEVVRDTGPTFRWRAESSGSLRITAPTKAVPKGLDLTLGYGERWPQVVRLTIVGAADEPIATFSLNPNALGWRRLVVDFKADAESNPSKAPPKAMILSTPGWSGDLWIGSVAWLTKVPYRRTPDPYCTSIYHQDEGPYFGDPKGQYAEAVREWLVAYQPPVPVAPPTQLDASVVYRRYLEWVLGTQGAQGPFSTAAATAHATWQADAVKQLEGMGLRRQGPWIVDANGVQPSTSTLRSLLTPVAFAYRRHPDKALLERLLLAFDAMHQGGFAVSNPAFGEDGSMLFVRLELANYAHAVGLLRDELATRGRLGRIHDILRWQSRAGEMDGQRRLEVNADSLRGEAFPRLICALSAPDNASRVRELANFRTWLTGGLAIQANLLGFIKPDLSVNHHHNAYLVEYGPHGIQAAAMASWVLAGTPWAMDRATLDRLEGCADTLVDLSRGYTLPMGVRGRFPDVPEAMAKSLGTFLALADTSIFSGRHADTARRLIQATGVSSAADEMAALAIKMRLGWRAPGQILATADALSDDKAPAAIRPLLAIHNWAGIANYRREGWSAAAQGCSRWHFDFESGNYPWVENDWGRFIRYGTIELWSGSDPFAEETSGLTLRRGWDWSKMPGATTLDLSAQDLGLPAPPKPRRMRNYSERGTCAGVAGPAGLGMFALDLQDTVYPGKLAARKSAFFAGDQIICLGSAIRSDLAEIPAITTLFQFGLPDDGNGVPPGTETVQDVAAGTSLTDPAGNVFTLLTPAQVVHRQGLQEGPASNGRISRGRYDTAWIDHGPAPTAAGYAYLIAPKVTGRVAERPGYEILRSDAVAQVVRFPAVKTTAHALFAPLTVPVGSLLACDRPSLVWVTESAPGQVELRVVDPDLGSPDGNQFGDHRESQPTQVVVDLAGHFTTDAPGISLSVAGDRTRCAITCYAGNPVIINLRRVVGGTTP